MELGSPDCYNFGPLAGVVGWGLEWPSPTSDSNDDAGDVVAESHWGCCVQCVSVTHQRHTMAFVSPSSMLRIFHFIFYFSWGLIPWPSDWALLCSPFKRNLFMLKQCRSVTELAKLGYNLPSSFLSFPELWNNKCVSHHGTTKIISWLYWNKSKYKSGPLLFVRVWCWARKQNLCVPVPGVYSPLSYNHTPTSGV